MVHLSASGASNMRDRRINWLHAHESNAHDAYLCALTDFYDVEIYVLLSRLMYVADGRRNALLANWPITIQLIQVVYC